MISATLKCGLGNMMFIISASSALAWDNNDSAVYNFDDYTTIPHRPPQDYRETIFRKLKLSDKTKKFPEYLYHDAPYKQIPYSNPLRIHGYFQSEKYFKNYSNRIKSMFESTSDIKNTIANKYQDILKGKTVSMQVRRGDYLALPDEHPVLKKEYYYRALELMPPINHILIFSDDVGWCKENLNFSINSTIIEEDDILSMYLMAECDHNIIANSTFSWWGAWLNSNNEKTVVTPEEWYGPAITNEGGDKKKCDDLLPISWIKLRGF